MRGKGWVWSEEEESGGEKGRDRRGGASRKEVRERGGWEWSRWKGS